MYYQQYTENTWQHTEAPRALEDHSPRVDSNGASAAANGPDGLDSANDHGQWRGTDFSTALFVGYWSNAAEAGARCVNLINFPWDVNDGVGVRAVCDSL